MVGNLGVGGDQPIRLQSMTTSDTQDVAATVRQSIALAEVGCEIIRITAPNVAAAKCLRDIRTQFSAAGFAHVPLVADIHFLPAAAMEAVEHVEKVRVNPGNYADKKKFAVKEYSDAAYDSELQRLYDSFSPLVIRSKTLGRAMRIGTNHGSLSDRIMNRYGDTPLGMVESALEFLRIARAHDYHAIMLSMKASNPKVMIQAYRLLVDRMQQEDMHYPLHLGVTEAGDGEDGRIKSAIGIGSLLLDGLGDTIRVSLTEDSVYEIPVARAIADKAMQQWRENHAAPPRPLTLAAAGTAELDPYRFTRRLTTTLPLAPTCLVGPAQPPRVIVPTTLNALAATSQSLAAPKFKDTPAEGLLVPINTAADLAAVAAFKFSADQPGQFLVLDLNLQLSPIALESTLAGAPRRFMLTREFGPADLTIFSQFLTLVRRHGQLLAAQIAPEDFPAYTPLLGPLGDASLIFTLATRHSTPTSGHALGEYRQLAKNLTALGSQAPIWIRNTSANALQDDPTYLSRLLEASFLSGSLLCDGLGDLISIETEPDVGRATLLAYNVLQGAGARLSKTEFVACPSCGRTLFDLQSTTQRIRAQTGHLKGVKLAIMGCIVNGPGEMADADFGYVGGAPGKINLYVGKNCVQYNIPEAEADARLIALMREHGKWAEPESSAATPTYSGKSL